MPLNHSLLVYHSAISHREEAENLPWHTPCSTGAVGTTRTPAAAGVRDAGAVRVAVASTSDLVLLVSRH